MPGDDIFGFTSPTGLGEPGDTGIASESTGGWGKGRGRYQVLTTKTEFSRTFRADFWAAFNVFGTGVRIRDVPDLDPVKRADFDGLSVEAAYRVLERKPGNPFAVTLSFEPRWARLDLNPGTRVEAYFGELKLFADAPVVPGRLYWGLNLNWDPGFQRETQAGAKLQRLSTTNVSTALTVEWNEHLFTGVEVRSLGTYEGLFLNRKVGLGLFAGPTALVAFNEHVSLNVAWTPEIRGHSRQHPARDLDLDDFPRHPFRVKLAVVF